MGYFTLFCLAFQDPYAGLYVLMQEEDEHTSAIVSWLLVYIYIVLETALVVVLKHLAIET